MTRSLALESPLLRTLAGSGVALSLSLVVLAAASAFAQTAGDAVDHELLVKFHAGQVPLTLDVSLQSAGVVELRHFPTDGLALSTHPAAQWVHVILAPDSDDEAAIEAIASSPAVELVNRNIRLEALGIPNDLHFAQQWSLLNTGQAGGTPGADIDAPAAWDLQTSAPAVVVAITDTGIEYTHPDLAANMWQNPGEVPGNGIDDDGNGIVDDVFGANFSGSGPPGDPMDDNIDRLFGIPVSHGTHVAGIVGAVGNNGLGVSGVVQNVRLMAVKFLDRFGDGDCARAISAVSYSIQKGADVINASWGGRPEAFKCTALRDWIALAGTQNILFVAAAGNDGTDNDLVEVQPASFRLRNLIAVAATDRNDELAVFNSTQSSNFGASRVQIAAPGKEIYQRASRRYVRDPERHVDGGPSRRGGSGAAARASPGRRRPPAQELDRPRRRHSAESRWEGFGGAETQRAEGAGFCGHLRPGSELVGLRRRHRQ